MVLLRRQSRLQYGPMELERIPPRQWRKQRTRSRRRLITFDPLLSARNKPTLKQEVAPNNHSAIKSVCQCMSSHQFFHRKDEPSAQSDSSKTAALKQALDERDRECKMLRAALAAQPPRAAPTTKPLRVAAPKPATK
eukprot:3110626-Amphidinium_carterae.1